WQKAKWSSLVDSFTNFDWLSCFHLSATSDDFIAKFYNVLFNEIDRFVPSSRSISSKRKKTVTRYPKTVRILQQKKSTLWRKFHRTGAIKDKIKYQNACKHIKRALRNLAIEKEEKILCSNDVGKFYRYVSSKLSCKSGVGALRNTNGDF